jgi:hypothetical protein
MQGQVDPLSELRDIHLPAGPSWWPPAPGWWWLALTLVLLTAAMTALYWLRRYRRLRLQRYALKTIAGLRARYRRGEALQPLAADLSVLLKNTATARFPEVGVAGLAGQPWLEFLDRRGGSLQVFTQAPGNSLASAPYQRTAYTDMERLLDLSERWIRTTT